MRHFVPDSVLDQLRKVLWTACHALVRTLEDDDAVGHSERLEDAARCERSAFIKAEQCSALRNPAALQLGLGWLGFHHHGDILQPAAKPRGNALVGRRHKAVECGAIH